MANPEQRHVLSPQSSWVRLCCWLAMQRGFIWGTVIFGVALNLFATWLITPWGSTFSNAPLGTLLNHFWISLGIGIGLLVLTGVVTLISHRINAYAPRTRSMQGPTQQNRNALVRALRQEYSRRLTHSLQGTVMIAVGLHERTDVIRSSQQLVFRRLSAAVEYPLPSGTSIIEAYDEAGQGLLTLGEPGAGKTTLLLELACELLIRAEGDPALPIPVIVNLSSWASKKAPLESWLIDQLQLVYSLPPRLSRAWLEQDQWLLLIDGLDEVEETSRPACIEAINTYREDHFTPLVVCSRSHEYLAQESRLILPNAVVVQPLQELQVTEYLKRLGKSMGAVRGVLRDNPTLRQLITTPLMLHVVALTYRDKTTKDLPHLGSREEQQAQIFNHYLERMLERQTTKGYFTPLQTRSWLIWLAQQMKQRHLTEFYLEWLQPSWLATKRARIVYRVLSSLVFWLIVGLGGELGFGLGGEMVVGLGFGLSAGLIVGLSAVLGAGLFIGLGARLEDIRPVEIFTLSWKNFLRGLVVGPIVGLGTGLIFGLRFELVVGLVVGLGFGLGTGLLAGLIAVLGAGLLSGTQVSKDIRTRPNQGIRKSGRNALRFGLVVALVFALSFGLAVGPSFGLIAGLGEARLVVGSAIAGLLVVGLGAGLVVGLVVGGYAYLHHYILRYLLRQSGAMPWHYIRFLEEATERILLQRIGGGYRFIHPLFLDYFASLETEVSLSSVRQSPPQP